MKPLDAKSPDGITIGLIDAMLTLAHTLNERLASELIERNRDPAEDDHAYYSMPVQRALRDLAGNPAIRRLLWPRDDATMKILHDAAKLTRKSA